MNPSACIFKSRFQQTLPLSLADGYSHFRPLTVHGIANRNSGLVLLENLAEIVGGV